MGNGLFHLVTMSKNCNHDLLVSNSCYIKMYQMLGLRTIFLSCQAEVLSFLSCQDTKTNKKNVFLIQFYAYFCSFLENPNRKHKQTNICKGISYFSSFFKSTLLFSFGLGIGYAYMT
jgi:hypothetical protein